MELVCCDDVVFVLVYCGWVGVVCWVDVVDDDVCLVVIEYVILECGVVGVDVYICVYVLECVVYE